MTQLLHSRRGLRRKYKQFCWQSYIGGRVPWSLLMSDMLSVSGSFDRRQFGLLYPFENLANQMAQKRRAGCSKHPRRRDRTGLWQSVILHSLEKYSAEEKQSVSPERLNNLGVPQTGYNVSTTNSSIATGCPTTSDAALPSITPISCQVIDGVSGP